MFLQNTIMITQYEFRNVPHLMASATGAIVFVGFLGRVLGISIAGSVFENMLQVHIRREGGGRIPMWMITAVMNSADAVWRVVPSSEERRVVLKGYVKTLDDVFLIGVPAGVLALVGALMMPVVRMDFSQHGGGGREKQGPGEEGGDVEKGGSGGGSGDEKSREGEDEEHGQQPV